MVIYDSTPQRFERSKLYLIMNRNQLSSEGVSEPDKINLCFAFSFMALRQKSI